MERKQNSLVAGSEALDDLPGPVQARHHFTVADQVNQLVWASEADPDLGFMARLPHVQLKTLGKGLSPI